MRYRVMHGSYGRLEDGVLQHYRRTDIVDLDPDVAARLGAQVEPVSEESLATPSGPAPVLPAVVTAGKGKKKPDDGEGLAT